MNIDAIEVNEDLYVVTLMASASDSSPAAATSGRCATDPALPESMAACSVTSTGSTAISKLNSVALNTRWSRWWCIISTPRQPLRRGTMRR